ncbi:hypothetical protein HY971_04050 [Candidatus Kaiserbacteria bacterium]|nr:hypothetical protein [Candidatus Kaiserbacteria bacterium]
MRTSLLVLVPSILLGGLILFGVSQMGGTSSKNAPCVLGTCPLSLHESDSGQTFIYSAGGRFSVFLDENNNPRSDLTCAPDGVIALRQYTFAEPPTYVAVFETKTSGTCVLTDKNFSATIVVK